MKTNKHVLLTNGQIIDVDSGEAKLGTIEVKRGIIERMYEKEDVLPTNIEKIDLKRKYVIPGLIDMHCHIREDFTPHFVAAGVTTVRNTAGDTYTPKPLIDAPLDAPTPTMYASDSLIDGEPGLWGQLDQEIL